METQALKAFMRSLLEEGGQLAMSYFLREPSQRAKKNPADIVTEADLAVSELIVKRINETYPTHHIHSEELAEDINFGAEFKWMLDPIDGTRNFATGIPSWCILLGLLRNGALYAGAVYSPIMEQFYFAKCGEGAFLNERKLQANSVESFDHCYAHIVSDRSHGVERERYNRAAIRFLEETNGWFTNHGSMYAACLIAEGKMDFFIHNAGNDYDYVAPAVICREAGVRVSDSYGNDWEPGRRDIVMAVPALYEKVLELFEPPGSSRNI